MTFNSKARGAIAVALLLPIGYLASVATRNTGVTVTPLTEDIFKVTVSGDTVFTQAAVLEADPDVKGLSWISGSEYVVKTPSTVARIDRDSGLVSFYDKDGNLIIRESEISESKPGDRKLSLIASGDDLLFGGGERGHSTTLNGDTLTFYNRQNYSYVEGDPRLSQMGISMPWIVSDKGYGILIDDYGKATALLGDTIAYTSNSDSPLSYYFINGDNLADAVSKFTALTGRQNLPPLWSLGYITSKYGYHTQDEALGVVDTLKNHGYPLDGIVLDLYWYGKETDMGRLEWNSDQWPDHKGMLDKLKKEGINTVLIMQPYINKIGALDNYEMLGEQGLLVKDAEGNVHDVTTWVGDAGMFDVSNPKTREWLWNRLSSLTREGVAGWWGDLGEPEVHPATMVHANGETAEQFHNVYGNVWSKLIYDGLRKDFPEMRPLLMMRGGTTGLQRYSVMPWTTDVSRSWGGLQPQIKLMLSSGLSGLGYMSSDIGGFAVEPENPTDPELYVRWMQMGVFTPTLRTHAQQLPEPYHYPEYEDIIKNYVEMRYQWLPYNYTLAFENSAYGYPLARPLNFRGDNPGKKFAEVADEYLWGDNVLVAPVIEQGATSRKVLFPSGEWVDFFNPLKVYQGNSEATVKAPLDKLPLFVRKGSFIPLYMGKVQNVGDYNPADITVKYYPSETETNYTLFDDNRLSPTSLEDGEYQLTTFTGIKNGKEIEVAVHTDGGSYPGMEKYKMITLEIIDVKNPKSVTLDGTAVPENPNIDASTRLGWKYDNTLKTLTVKFPWVYECSKLMVN